MKAALVLLLLATSVASARVFTPEQLKQRQVERRAMEAMVWGMSAVNTEEVN